MSVFILFIALLVLTLVFFLILSRQEKEKNDFFHVMAHRLRSPISIVRWYIELISDKSVGDLNEKQKEYLMDIYNASEKLNETIDSLGVLLQLQSNDLHPKIEKVDVKDLIIKVIQKYKSKIEKNRLHLQENYPKQQEIAIQADLKLLGIVLQNLIENAVKYAPENGNINIDINFSNKRLLIEIKHNGYGIPNGKGSKVLTNSPSFRDMSFGLHLAKTLLIKMRAKIKFNCQENKGTTFFVSLPA